LSRVPSACEQALADAGVDVGQNAGRAQTRLDGLGVVSLPTIRFLDRGRTPNASAPGRGQGLRTCTTW
jgi:hypothetical protein